MKKLGYILSLFFLMSCNSEYAWDCVQESGPIIEREFRVRPFKIVQAWDRVQLIVIQGDAQNVRVETGENLMNEIQLVVKDSILTISDRNSCNWVREYGITKVYVTAPDLYEIRNSSGLTVESRGIIAFKELRLVSEDPENLEAYHHDGDFKMDLDVETLKIRANGISRFYLSGKARFGQFLLLDGDVRVEAENLEVKTVQLYHRSTNKLIVNPINIIRGEIRGLGDVISKNRPPVIEVEEFNRGKLIFE